MQSNDTTPRFRNLSINGTPRFVSTSVILNEKEHEEPRNPEKECFMCRQANVYIKPIGMQQERRVARRHPPPLTRAQIEELCEKKKLTKREVRLLLQCYFPEIKNVKYFQLHKYHSCCYDPKHLNLCKNHITALQHEREQHPNHQHRQNDEHFKKYERDVTNQHRVSFVRIKIEPTKGIPTRFLGPTALPEPLADMLIKQVNRLENKKKLPSFNDETQSALETHTVKRMQQPYELDNGVSRLSEHLATLKSDDDEEEEEEEEEDDDNDEDTNDNSSPSSNIRGYQGKVMGQSQMKYERKLQSKQEKEKEKSATNGNHLIHHQNGDLVVEDIDELTELFVHEQNPVTNNKPAKELKKKKRKKRTKKRAPAHQKPKLNHWEIMALDQSQQQPCGCRHHVRRLEADQVVYDWCRCKDHLHRGVKERRKSIPPPPPPPAPSTPPPPVTLPPKPKKVRKRTIGINATERTTTELALAYDPTTVDYDVIQEVLYYRTSSGRLVKPEITNAFGFNNVSSSKGANRFKSLTGKSTDSLMPPRDQIIHGEIRLRKNGSPMTDSPIFSTRGSLSYGRTLVNSETSMHNGISILRTTYEEPELESETPVENNRGMYDGIDKKNKDDNKDEEEQEEEDDDDDDDDDDDIAQFIAPKYLTKPPPMVSSARSPTVPMSMQKSSKPTYINEQPTPNFERESSVVANRRWFDQALGDQNLLSVHDGQYGLIAGTSAEQYHFETQLPDNDYVEPYTPKNRSACTIS